MQEKEKYLIEEWFLNMGNMLIERIRLFYMVGYVSSIYKVIQIISWQYKIINRVMCNK